MKFVIFYCEHHIIHGPGKVFAVCGRPRKHPNAVITFTGLIVTPAPAKPSTLAPDLGSASFEASSWTSQR